MRYERSPYPIYRVQHLKAMRHARLCKLLPITSDMQKVTEKWHANTSRWDALFAPGGTGCLYLVGINVIGNGEANERR